MKEIIINLNILYEKERHLILKIESLKEKKVWSYRSSWLYSWSYDVNGLISNDISDLYKSHLESELTEVREDIILKEWLLKNS